MFALCFMFIGMALGFLLRKSPVSGWISRLVMPFVLILLFCMGVLIGGSETIMGNLPTLGLRGFILAASTLAGSVIVVSSIVRLFPKSLDNSAPQNGRQGTDR